MLRKRVGLPDFALRAAQAPTMIRPYASHLSHHSTESLRFLESEATTWAEAMAHMSSCGS